MQINKKELTIKSRLEELHNMRKLIKKFLSSLKLDENLVNMVVLSIDEAVANIIEHGYGLKSTGIIDIMLEVSKSKLSAKIYDTTKSFDPKRVPLSSPAERMKTRKQRGLGLIIIRRFMDDIHYKFTEDNKNELTLIKYIGVVNEK